MFLNEKVSNGKVPETLPTGSLRFTDSIGYPDATQCTRSAIKLSTRARSETVVPMTSNTILLPALAQVILTLMVRVFMFSCVVVLAMTGAAARAVYES